MKELDSMRHVSAAAMIIHHEGRILLVLKEGWDQFSLPMTKLHDVENGVSRETGRAAAIRVIQEELGAIPADPPGLLLDTELPQISGRTGEVGHYQVQVYHNATASADVSHQTTARWLTPQEILNPATEDVAATAVELIKKLSEASLQGQREFPPQPSADRRTSIGSVAIIHRKGTNGLEYLAQFNEKWGRYYLVGGHQEPGESTVDCIVRELQEELSVARDEMTLSDGQLLTFTAWSTAAWQTTDYRITAFQTELSEATLGHCTSKAENRWLTLEEIERECSKDGMLISPTTRHLLQLTGEV